MSEKRILLADANAEAVAEFNQVFAPPWEVTTVTSGPAALAELAKRPFEVLVADLDLPELDGAALLNQTRQDHPQTLCFILASDADRERVMQNVLGAHQFLSKPCDPATLKNHIERALALNLWIASNSMRELVARVRTFPTVPSLYLEVLSVLKSPDATTEQVGRILARDMAMMTKLLQVINSACFGLPRRISDPAEAVGLMGFDAVKSMVMTIKLLSQYDKIKPVYFSIDRLWRHSTDVARSAKALVLFHTDDPALAEIAFTAGLIHDMGKVVLAANFDEQYRGAQSLARKQKLPLWEVEREIFGASHGEIGAYLLGLWGMPLDLLECAALHHQPARSITREFTPLTAVHIANALEHEATPDKEETGLVSRIDQDYLSEIGVLDKLEGWREAVLNRNFAPPEPKRKTAPTETSKIKMLEQPALRRQVRLTQARVVQPVTPEPKPRSFGVGRPVQQRKWLYLAVGLGIMIPLAAWLLISTPPDDTAQPPAAGSVPNPTNLAIETPPSEPSAPAALSASAAPSAPEQNTAAPSTPNSILAPTLTVRARTATTTNNVPAAASTTAKEPAFADLQLQGVFYLPNNASAIISGKMVRQNEEVSGARVLEITPTSVTLEYQNQRKTLRLK